jgi:hypothetical protein
MGVSAAGRKGGSVLTVVGGGAPDAPSVARVPVLQSFAPAPGVASPATVSVVVVGLAASAVVEVPAPSGSRLWPIPIEYSTPWNQSPTESIAASILAVIWSPRTTRIAAVALAPRLGSARLWRNP